MKKVILDTSFLITLTDKAREHHDTACRYWEHFIEHNIAMYIPTIVVSEYHIKGPIPNYVYNQCILAPFNLDDAQAAAELGPLLAQRTSGEPRVCLKDDLKIIAQALVLGAEFTICDDHETFHKYVGRAAQHASSRLRSLVLKEGFKSTNRQLEFAAT